MRAIIHDPKKPNGLVLAEAKNPAPKPNEALIEVHAVSLNYGEVKYLDKMRKPGEVPGWDAAGVIVREAADGSGPKKGTHVASFGAFGGAWAELRAVDTKELGVVPEAVDLGAAASIVVAGVTALRALRALGPIVGRRVLITGASGGVGRAAVQLARRAGAHVIAGVSKKGRDKGLTELGAHEIVDDLKTIEEPVFGVVEGVGGPLLAQALAVLGEGGTLLSVGKASGEDSTIDFEAERQRPAGRSIGIFMVGGAQGNDIEYLTGLLAEKAFDAQIDWRKSWDHIEDATTALLGHQVSGKIVLDVKK